MDAGADNLPLIKPRARVSFPAFCAILCPVLNDMAGGGMIVQVNVGTWLIWKHINAKA